MVTRSTNYETIARDFLNPQKQFGAWTEMSGSTFGFSATTAVDLLPWRSSPIAAIQSHDLLSSLRLFSQPVGSTLGDLMTVTLLRRRIDRMSREFEELRTEAGLPSNWDGEGANAVSGAAAASTGSLLFAISRVESWKSTMIPDNLVATADGGVYLDWDMDERRLELFIDPSGSLSLVTVSKEDGIDVDWCQKSTLSLADMISALRDACTQHSKAATWPKG